MIGMSFFLPFLPLYLKELGVRSTADISTWSGVLFSAGFLMLSLVAPLWGSLADRFGRKRMVVRAMGAAAVVVFLSAFVRVPAELLALRLVHGLFSGFVSSAVALISAETPSRSLGFALGVFQSSLTAGMIAGPLLGGALMDQFGIRPTLQWGGAILLVGTMLVWMFVDERHKPDPNARRHTVFQNARYLFSNAALWPAVRIQFLSNLAMVAVQPLLALFVTLLAPASAPRIGTLSGLVISASALSMMVGAPFWGRMVDRVGQKKVLVWCLVLSGACFLPQAAAGTVAALAAGRFLMGFFAAGIMPSLQSLIAHHSPAERRSGILGISFSMTLMGTAIGPLLGGALAAATSVRAPFVMTALILASAGWLSARLDLRLIKAPPTPLAPAE